MSTDCLVPRFCGSARVVVGPSTIYFLRPYSVISSVSPCWLEYRGNRLEPGKGPVVTTSRGCKTLNFMVKCDSMSLVISYWVSDPRLAVSLAPTLASCPVLTCCRFENFSCDENGRIIHTFGDSPGVQITQLDYVCCHSTWDGYVGGESGTGGLKVGIP